MLNLHYYQNVSCCNFGVKPPQHAGTTVYTSVKHIIVKTTKKINICRTRKKCPHALSPAVRECGKSRLYSAIKNRTFDLRPSLPLTFQNSTCYLRNFWTLGGRQVPWSQSKKRFLVKQILTFCRDDNDSPGWHLIKQYRISESEPLAYVSLFSEHWPTGNAKLHIFAGKPDDRFNNLIHIEVQRGNYENFRLLTKHNVICRCYEKLTFASLSLWNVNIGEWKEIKVQCCAWWTTKYCCFLAVVYASRTNHFKENALMVSIIYWFVRLHGWSRFVDLIVLMYCYLYVFLMQISLTPRFSPHNRNALDIKICMTILNLWRISIWPSSISLFLWP